MNDTQLLTIALASLPSVLAVMIGTLINNSRLTDLRAHVDMQFQNVERRFDSVDQRFDDMRDTWRAGLRRVEEVLDAHLKHLEERFDR